jgi:DNA-binding MarR family transcriptional regulator
MGEMRTGSDAEGTIVEGLGIRRSLVEALTLKSLYYLGEASLHELAQQMCISRSVVESTFQRLRKEQLCQAVGMTVGMHRISLTQAGRVRAGELLGVDATFPC